MRLFRLAYLSKSTLEGALEDQRDELADILERSRRRNLEEEITGALLVACGHFAQLLEGERSAVETAYRRIAGDSRHGALVLLLAGPISRRQFAQWPLAYVRLDGNCDDVLAQIGEAAPEAELDVTGREILTLMGHMLSAHQRIPLGVHNTGTPIWPSSL